MSNSPMGYRIVILSPQSWNHLIISKHHYARTLAAGNEVLFMTPPNVGLLSFGAKIVTPDQALPKLRILTLGVSWPNRFRFYFPKLFSKVHERKVLRWLKKNFGPSDLLIDFGWYRQVADVRKFDARKKIFFPVDDLECMPIDGRGADALVTVSTAIRNKFTSSGLSMELINHGLADSFVRVARRRLEKLSSPTSTDRVGPIKVGYSGNVFISFLDRDVVIRCLEGNRDKEFYFFGNSRPGTESEQQWFDILSAQPNAHLEGQKDTEALVESLNAMDVLLVCYKPDYKNYHGENTHKMVEYLSTGKLVVSSHISYYADFDFIAMAEKDKNEQIVTMLQEITQDSARVSDVHRREKQIRYAIENSYGQRCRELLQMVGL